MLRIFIIPSAVFSFIAAKPILNKSMDLGSRPVNGLDSSSLISNVPLTIASSVTETDPIKPLTVDCVDESLLNDAYSDGINEKRDVLQRESSCPTSLTTTDSDPSGQNIVKPSKQRSRGSPRAAIILDRPCRGSLKPEHVSCGGPEVAEPDDVNVKKVLNCVKGESFKLVCSLFQLGERWYHPSWKTKPNSWDLFRFST